MYDLVCMDVKLGVFIDARLIDVYGCETWCVYG
jgi:hypothetical protein